MARQASLRAADSDRETVTERLREAAAEGRLDPEELEERVHTALRARTYGELDLVLADLPARSRALGARRVAVGLPSAETAIACATRVAVALVVVTLILVDAALTVTWWLICVLLRAHGYAAGRFGAHPGRPAPRSSSSA
jgi:hypothetical protein